MPTGGQFVVGELVTSTDANTLFVRGYQNRVINGAFVVNQREYVSGANLASGFYGFDRWKSAFTNTSLTFTAGSASTIITISTSGIIQQIIERENVPAGTYILSYFGTATARVYNSGGTPPAFSAAPITVALDGTANVVVEFTASGASKTLGLVQLEGGTVFSPFEFRQRSDEILLCQRYFFRIRNVGGFSFMERTTPGVNFSNAISLLVNFPATMRATPVYSHVSGASAVDNYGSASACSLSSSSGTLNSFRINYSTSGLTDFRPYFLIGNPDLVAQLNAEL